MKRYLLALFYFLSVGWMPLSVHAANSDIWAIQGYGKLNNVDVMGADKNGVIYISSMSNINLGPSLVVASTNTFLTGQGLQQYIWLNGGTTVSAGSAICVAATPTTGLGLGLVSGAACTTTAATTFIGISQIASSTGTSIPIWVNGWVIALTSGTVTAGDILISSAPSSGVQGYLGTNNSPTAGTEIGRALGSASNGLTRVWIH